MNTRRIREERHRLVLGTSLVLSLALHGVLLGTHGFQGRDPAGETSDVSAETPVFQVPSIELVQIVEPPEQVVPDPVVTDAPRILTAPTSEEISEPRSGDALLAKSGEAAASAAAPEGGAEVADDPLPSTALSMRPRFGFQQRMPESTRKPIEALDPLAEHDNAEGEGDEERSWWRRLGAKFGIGSGSKICVPRPEVIDTVPKVAEK